MSRCDDIRPLLDDWLDDMLDAAEKTRVDAHLQICDTCRRKFERHAETAGDLAALGAIADEIASRSPAYRPAASRWSGRAARWRSGLAAAAVVILGLSLTITGWRHTPPPPIATTMKALHVGVQEPPIATASAFSITPSSDKLAERCESSNPRIHIVWLYDEVRPAETSTHNEANPNNNPPA